MNKAFQSQFEKDFEIYAKGQILEHTLNGTILFLDVLMARRAHMGLLLLGHRRQLFNEKG